MRAVFCSGVSCCDAMLRPLAWPSLVAASRIVLYTPEAVCDTGHKPRHLCESLSKWTALSRTPGASDLRRVHESGGHSRRRCHDTLGMSLVRPERTELCTDRSCRR